MWHAAPVAHPLPPFNSGEPLSFDSHLNSTVTASPSNSADNLAWNPAVSSTSTVDSRWFAAEVHAHERSLRAYLRGAFPSVRDVDDVVQESYVRVWKARLAHPIQSARSFLFQVA